MTNKIIIAQKLTQQSNETEKNTQLREILMQQLRDTKYYNYMRY